MVFHLKVILKIASLLHHSIFLFQSILMGDMEFLLAEFDVLYRFEEYCFWVHVFKIHMHSSKSLTHQSFEFIPPRRVNLRAPVNLFPSLMIKLIET